MIPGIVAGSLLSGTAPVALLAGAYVWRTTNQAFLSAAGTMDFDDADAELSDDAGMHDLVTNPSRITVLEDGLYRAVAHFSHSNTGTINASIRRSNSNSYAGAPYCNGYRGATTPQGFVLATGILACTAAQYFTLYKETSTTSMTAGAYRNWLSVERFDPGQKYVLLTKSGTQAIADGVATELTWNTAVENGATFVNLGVSNTDVVIPETGRYRVTVGVRGKAFAGVNATLRGYARHNGALVRGLPIYGMGGNLDHFISAFGGVIECTAGDTIRGMAQAIGQADIIQTANTFLCVEKVDPAIKVCLVATSANQTMNAGYNWLNWNVNVIAPDDPAMHDGDDVVFTVPPGCTEARLTASMLASAGNAALIVEQNNAASPATPGTGPQGWSGSNSGRYCNATTGWVPVVPGDKFRAWAHSSAAGNTTTGTTTWACFECR